MFDKETGALIVCKQIVASTGVHVVLGHFIFVYIHPFMGGNGRTGRFLIADELNASRRWLPLASYSIGSGQCWSGYCAVYEVSG